MGVRVHSAVTDSTRTPHPKNIGSENVYARGRSNALHGTRALLLASFVRLFGGGRRLSARREVGGASAVSSELQRQGLGRRRRFAALLAHQHALVARPRGRLLVRARLEPLHLSATLPQNRGGISAKPRATYVVSFDASGSRTARAASQSLVIIRVQAKSIRIR